MKKLSALIGMFLCTIPTIHAQDGSSCANAIPLLAQATYDVDTTSATNWMTVFGPLASPSNDIAYKFTAPTNPTGGFTPVAANYPFAMYLIPACSDAGAEPAPIGATATIGSPIYLAGVVMPGTEYYLAVTGTAAGGAGANGMMSFTTPVVPVTLQSFEID